MTGLTIASALALFALVGPFLIPHDPNASDFTLTRSATGAPPGPSASHWLGVDPLFRDVLARLASGARVSLAISLLATALSTIVGAAVGISAGWCAGTRLAVIDTVLMRIVDVMLALPFLLLVTAIGVAVGRADLGTILLVLGLTGWTVTARLVRGKTLEIKRLDFVLAARALGARSLHVIARHVIPNIAPTLLVVATTSVAQMILAEAVLGYLTVGLDPPRATWGRMLHESEQFLSVRLALVAAPAFAILLAVLGFARVGEGLRKALDPKRETASRNRLPIDLALAAIALALVGFASPNRVRPPLAAAHASEAPQRGGWLRVATSVNVRTLDPALAYDEAAIAIQGLLFGRLVSWNDRGEIAPDLAESLEASSDAKTYTFTLRHGVHFHDGGELTAEDVKRSLERMLHPRTPSPAATSYFMIAGAEAYHAGRAPEVSGIRVLGRYAIAFDLATPDATFLPVLTLAFAAPVCPSMGARVDTKNPAKPCGTGPFRLASWDSDAGGRLERHEGYYVTGKPYLDGITWSTNVRPTSQRYKFEDGDIDYVSELPAIESALYRSDPAWAGLGRWTSKRAINAIFMNTEMPPFSDRHVRRAVALAVDPSVVEKIRPDVRESDRVLPDSIPGPDRKEPMRRHDEAAALAEMAAAGYAFDPTTGRGGYPHAIDYITLPDTLEQQSAEIYQQQLARIGIQIRLHLVTYATYFAEISRRRTVPMGWCGWNADFPDPANFFEPNLSSSAIAEESSQNAAFFANATFDALLARAHREIDPAQRRAEYAEAEAIVRDEAPWAPTYVSRSFELWQPYVRGYAPHPILPAHFNDVWFDGPARTSARAMSRLGAIGSIAFAPFGGRAQKARGRP
jgi:ABC-type transport system substrate-binding protein/ABC-type dipeptide/oligopeptide/nickel transport system permease subunit